MHVLKTDIQVIGLKQKFFHLYLAKCSSPALQGGDVNFLNKTLYYSAC